MSFSMIFLLVVSCMHDFHMAKTEVVINPEKQRYEVTQFVFLDDLQEALSVIGHPELNLCTPTEKDSADIFIQDYIKENFKVSADNNALDSVVWIGKEISHDLAGVYIYYTLSTANTSPTQLNIKNTIFTEIFDDQKNLVYLTHADGTKDYLMLSNSVRVEEIFR